MGNYNCQECINKEVNILNELLLDNNIFSNESLDQDNPTLTQTTQIKNLRGSKDDLRKAIEKTNLSEKQKNFVQKMLNENTDDFIDLEENTIKLRVGQKDMTDENINNNNENDILKEEQKKIIEHQKEQILEQQKIIEDYKKQQLLLEEQQNKLKEEEENIKKQIQQAQAEENEREKEEVKQENIQDIRIKNLESSEVKNENVENFEKEENEQIIISQENEKNENENKIEQIMSRSPQNNINILRQNIHPKKIENEEENQHMEEQESSNILQQQRMNYDNYIEYQNQIQQLYNQGIELGQVQPQHHQSQKFKVETYEPIEPGSKNNNDYDNDNIIDELNDNEDDNYDDNIYLKKEKKSKEPRDNTKSSLRRSMPQHEEDDINNMNNYKNYVQEKVNLRQRSPKDNEKSSINYKFNLEEEENEMNIRIIEEKENIKKTGPRDNVRMDSKPKFYQNIFIFNKNEPLKQKKKMPVNKNKIEDEMTNENQEIKINKKNLKVNQISSAISNGVLNENNIIQQQQNNGQYSENKYRFVKKEILSPSNINYFSQQEYNTNNIVTTDQYYSPQFNQMNYAALNNNMNNLENYENYEKEVNIMTTSNQIDGNVTPINSNSNKPRIGPQGNEEQQYDYAEFQQSSQNDYDMTFSDRDNPLIYSDDKGNMNYLERQYAAYENRMNNDNDY